MPTERLGRAALMAFTTLVASGSVGCTESHELDGGVDAHVGAFDAAYGGVDASFTAPDVGRDAPSNDAQSNDAASSGCPDASFAGMYGLPPPCPDR
jgi:hypothetical protein